MRDATGQLVVKQLVTGAEIGNPEKAAAPFIYAEWSER